MAFGIPVVGNWFKRKMTERERETDREEVDGWIERNKEKRELERK